MQILPKVKWPILAGFARRVSIFGPSNESISLALPLFFLAMLGIESTLGYSWTPEPKTVYFLFPAIFGSGHTIFTYILLLVLPEGREVFRGVLKRSWWQMFLGLGFLISLIIFYSLSAIKQADSDFYLRTAKFALLYIFGQHALGQIRGLSMLYNRAAEQRFGFSFAQRKWAATLERWERRIHYAILAFYLLILFSEFIPDGRIVSVCLIFLLALPTAAVVLSMFYPYADQSNKTFFLLRLYLFAFGGLLPTAFFALFIMHGLEYEQLLFKMIGSSIRKLTAIKYFAICAILFGVSPFAHLAYIFNESLPRSLLIGCAIFSSVTDQFHYYVDALIFRFVDPEIRNNFGSLVMPLEDKTSES